jgi:hypothetical protein
MNISGNYGYWSYIIYVRLNKTHSVHTVFLCRVFEREEFYKETRLHNIRISTIYPSVNVTNPMLTHSFFRNSWLLSLPTDPTPVMQPKSPLPGSQQPAV